MKALLKYSLLCLLFIGVSCGEKQNRNKAGTEESAPDSVQNKGISAPG
jgi:hypothetical protein